MVSKEDVMKKEKAYLATFRRMVIATDLGQALEKANKIVGKMGTVTYTDTNGFKWVVRGVVVKVEKIKS